MTTNQNAVWAGLCLLAALTFAGCKTTEETTDPSPVAIKDYSINPSLVKTLDGFSDVKINTLISSDDKLAESPAFVFGGQPDGAALLKNPNGKGFILLNNHEIMQSVSRVYLDETFKPVKGEYIVDGDGGQFRLCSATLATPEEHGFGPVFLTVGESGGRENMVHAIDPIGAADKTNKTRVKPALGKQVMENAVPLPKDSYPGKTVILIGEDDSQGQLLAYVSNTVGDLDNGKLYFLRRTNLDPVETNMTSGTSYDVEFVEVTDAKTSTSAQIATKSVETKAIQFARVEDVDYRKGSAANGREIYFVATGILNGPASGKTMWGRAYHLTLNATDPLKGGKMQIIADGAVDPGKNIVNPDNICVTENFVYIQEDGDSFYPGTNHDGRVWQYGIASKALKPMIEMNHRREDATFSAKYTDKHPSPAWRTNKSSWEYGAMFDISDLVGKPNTFLLNLHPHTWRDPKYVNADGSTVTKGDLSSAYSEGGQVVILSGVPK